MSDDQWAEVRQKWQQASEHFRVGMRQLTDEQRLRRAMPSNGGRQPDSAARLLNLGEQLKARRRQKTMRGLGVIVTISFLAGWLGGRSAVSRERR